MNKRVFVLVVIMVLVAHMIFADPDPTSVKIKTAVQELIEHKVSSSRVINYDTFEGTPVSVDGIVVSIDTTDKQELPAYYSMRTNTLKKVRVHAMIPALKNTETEYYIPFTTYVGVVGTDDYYAKGVHSQGAGSDPIEDLKLVIISAGEASGHDFADLPDQFLYSGQLAIQFDQSYIAAPAGDYQSIITFHIGTE